MRSAREQFGLISQIPRCLVKAKPEARVKVKASLQGVVQLRSTLDDAPKGRPDPRPLSRNGVNRRPGWRNKKIELLKKMEEEHRREWQNDVMNLDVAS